MDDHFKYCAARVREFDRDRYLATLFAPADKRGALFALYAFNVELSRVRDLAREPIPGEIRLQWWREVILGERGGEAGANPIAAAIMQVLTNYNVPAEKLAGLVEAHRFDIYNEPIASLADFQSYASKSIGSIFELAGQIFAKSHNWRLPTSRYKLPKRNSSRMYWLRCSITPRIANSMSLGTFFITMARVRKTSLRSGRHPRCEQRSQNFACAVAVI